MGYFDSLDPETERRRRQEERARKWREFYGDRIPDAARTWQHLGNGDYDEIWCQLCKRFIFRMGTFCVQDLLDAVVRHLNSHHPQEIGIEESGEWGENQALGIGRGNHSDSGHWSADNRSEN